jgi:hypothetical protein
MKINLLIIASFVSLFSFQLSAQWIQTTGPQGISINALYLNSNGMLPVLKAAGIYFNQWRCLMECCEWWYS